MANDRPNRISWKAGEILVHGNSEKYLLHVLAEHFMQQGKNLVTIEPLDEEENKARSRFEEGRQP
jgi:hypothetical protein